MAQTVAGQGGDCMLHVQLGAAIGVDRGREAGLFHRVAGAVDRGGRDMKDALCPAGMGQPHALRHEAHVLRKGLRVARCLPPECHHGRAGGQVGKGGGRAGPEYIRIAAPGEPDGLRAVLSRPERAQQAAKPASRPGDQAARGRGSALHPPRPAHSSDGAVSSWSWSSSSACSAIHATETTSSPLPVSNTLTPPALRERKEMPSTGTRIDCPREVASMIWSSSVTGKEATSGPPRIALSIAMTPWPPRPRTG